MTIKEKNDFRNEMLGGIKGTMDLLKTNFESMFNSEINKMMMALERNIDRKIDEYFRTMPNNNTKK